MYLLDTNVISEIRKKGRANKGVRAFFQRAAREEIDLFPPPPKIYILKVIIRGDKLTELDCWASE